MPTHHQLTTTLRRAGCVFAEQEAALLIAAATNDTELHDLLHRRIHGTPLEHLLGWVDFCDTRIHIEPGVFIPRQRSTHLVHQARHHLTDTEPPATILDLCCGTGALSTALLRTHPELTVHATDNDPAALRSARHNLPTAHLHHGDLYAPLPDTLHGQFRLILANAPYVPTDELGLMPREARDHEPRNALDGGTDGLDLHRRIATDAPRWLAPGGHLLIETSQRQAETTRDILRAHGFHTQLSRSDELDATIAIGTREN